MNQPQPKPFLQSKTVISSLTASLLSLLAALSTPYLDNKRDGAIARAEDAGLPDKRIELIRSRYENYKTMVVIVCTSFAGTGGILAALGRASAKQKVYSFPWLLGYNKADLEKASTLELDDSQPQRSLEVGMEAPDSRPPQ